MGLKLRQIEAFRAVMRTGSMTGAADLLAVGQPAISYQIASLEAAVAFPLFTRAKGKLAPTPEAVQLLTEVDRLYDGLAGIESAANDIATHRRAILRVLLTSTFSNAKVVCAIGRFVAKHPGLRIDLDIVQRATVIRNVANGLADVGVVSLPVNASGTIVTPLFTTELVCVVPHSHWLAVRTCITPDDIAAEPIVAMKAGGVVRPLVDQWFTSAGVHRSFECEAGDALAAVELVRAGLGVTIVSGITAASLVTPQDLALKVVPLHAMDSIQIGAIMPEIDGGNRTAASLLDFLKSEPLQ